MNLWPLGITALVVVADQATKAWIMATFYLHEQLEVIPGFFNLTHVTNTGAAFGLLAGEQNHWRRFFFIGVALAALVVIGFSYRHLKNQGTLFVFAVSLIGGGALGNLIDRIRFGAVVDFLDFYVGSHHWPAFNVADSSITVGVALFLLAGVLKQKSEDRKQQTED